LPSGAQAKYWTFSGIPEFVINFLKNILKILKRFAPLSLDSYGCRNHFDVKQMFSDDVDG